MSTKVTNWVWEHSTARGSALILMLRLADMANDDGWCYPGNAHLAETCRIDERNLRQIKERLKASGELFIRERRRSANRNDTNLYRILMREVEDHTIPQVEDHTIPQVEDHTIPQWGITRSSDPLKALRTETRTRARANNQPPMAERHLENRERKTTLEEGNSASSVFPNAPQSEKEQGQKQKQSRHSPTRRTATKSTRSAAHEPRDLRRYAEPLADADNEALAMKLLAAATDLSRENARMLVDVYGLSPVWDALNLFYATGGVVRRPGAWIRKLLQRTLQTEWQQLEEIKP